MVVVHFTEMRTSGRDVSMSRKCICVCRGRVMRAGPISDIISYVECYTVWGDRGTEGWSLGGHWESDIDIAHRKVRIRRSGDVYLEPNDNSIIRWWYGMRIDFSKCNPEFQVMPLIGKHDLGAIMFTMLEGFLSFLFFILKTCYWRITHT